MNKLISVSGVKNSGKSTFANMLQYCLSVPKIFRQYWIYKAIHKIIPKKYKILAFADPVKKMLSVLLNVPINSFSDRSFKEHCVVNIPTLKLSTDDNVNKLSDSKFNKLVKVLDSSLTTSNLSVRQLMQYFATQIMQTYFTKKVWINCTLLHLSKYTIISDLRFKEEFNAIKEKNGICIYIQRPGYSFGEHASEKEMSELLQNDKYDYVIENSGNIKDLFNTAKILSNGL